MEEPIEPCISELERPFWYAPLETEEEVEEAGEEEQGEEEGEEGEGVK